MKLTEETWNVLSCLCSKKKEIIFLFYLPVSYFFVLFSSTIKAMKFHIKNPGLLCLSVHNGRLSKVFQLFRGDSVTFTTIPLPLRLLDKDDKLTLFFFFFFFSDIGFVKNISKCCLLIFHQHAKS